MKWSKQIKNAITNIETICPKVSTQNGNNKMGISMKCCADIASSTWATWEVPRFSNSLAMQEPMQLGAMCTIHIFGYVWPMTWKLIIKGISPDIPRKDGSTYVAYVLYATDWYLVPPSFWDGTKYLTQHMVQNIILAFFHILHIIIMFYIDLHGTMWGPPVISC